MIAALTTVAATILSSVGSYFSWAASKVRQRRLAAADVAKEDAAAEAKKEEIRQAVYANNDAKLTEIVSQLLED